MESHVKQTRFALRPGLQQGQVFEIFDGDSGEVLQNGFPRDQVFDSLHGDPNSLVRHEPKQGEVFEMLDGNISNPIQCESQHDHTFDISHGDINRTIGYADHVPWEASGLVYRSCEPSFLASQAPKNPNDQEWRDIKPVFERLYSTENRTLKDVKTILERDRGFVASERMYKARISAWKLHKNLKKAEKAVWVQKIRQTGAGGQLIYNGRPVEHRLRRFCKENRVPAGPLREITRHYRDRRRRAPIAVSSRIESATFDLHSFFQSPSQPAPPIALYGDIRFAEEIVRNVDIYMNFYFTSGLGTWYYKVDPTVPARNELTLQSQVLIKNQEAWRDIVRPETVIRQLDNALYAFRNGFIETAFQESHKALDLVKTILEQQTPTLISYFFAFFTSYRTYNTSQFEQNISQFLIDMASNVLGKTHPMMEVINHLYMLSGLVEKCSVWRAATDVLEHSFRCLKDDEPVRITQWWYGSGIRAAGLITEAQDYLDVICGPNGTIQEQKPRYMGRKACFLAIQRKYLEAEIQLRECLELLEEDEFDILAEGSDSDWLGWCGEIHGGLFHLAETLENTDRVDEAKAMWWRVIEFGFVVFGPEGVETRIFGSTFDKFLTWHGAMEERAVLRAQCPWLLSRKEIPKEFR